MAKSPSVSDFVDTKKLKNTKATGGKFAYIDQPGEFLVCIQSAGFGNKEKPSGGKGSAFFAVENKILTSTADEKHVHLRVGKVANHYAEDEGNQAKVYLPKIKNVVEAVLAATPDEVNDMDDDAFAKTLDILFMEKQGAAGEVVFIKAVATKNQAKEDRVYATYYVATDEQLAEGGLMRDAKGNFVPL